MKNNESLWGEIRSLLLVTHFSNVDELKKYREALKEAKLNVHVCGILAVVETKKEKQTMLALKSVVYCSEQEINLFGRLKNEEAMKQLSNRYDALMVVGDYSSRFEKLLKKVRVKVSIGANSSVDFLTLKLKTDSASPSHLINFAKQTLEKINKV
ncbi:MAG: hypothetical protein JKY09_05460 [Crocinitomicaceae bacterium]|nr:hypothetical protein [Crocinitomicaceae bacterium]